MSKWHVVLSGVPQESIWSLVLFNMFINDLDAEIKSFLIKFVSYIKLGRTASTLEDRVEFIKL